MKSVYTKLIDMAVKEMADEMAKRFTAALERLEKNSSATTVTIPRKPFQNLLRRVKETESCKSNSKRYTN